MCMNSRKYQLHTATKLSNMFSMKLRIFRESYHDFFNFFEKKIPRKLPRSFDNKKLQKKKKKKN